MKKEFPIQNKKEIGRKNVKVHPKEISNLQEIKLRKFIREQIKLIKIVNDKINGNSK